MKAKCPFCDSGCEKCENGFMEITIVKGMWIYRVCCNQEECGFVNGGSAYDGSRDLDEDDTCIICDGPTEWKLPDNISEERNWEKPENATKWRMLRDEKTIEELKNTIKKFRTLSVAILNGKTDLTLDDYRLLNVCRICHQPQSVPFKLNFGEEYAHTFCLENT